MTPNPRELVSSPRMERIVSIGAGGHCRVLVDIIHRSGAFAIVGLVDRDLALVGRLVEGASASWEGLSCPSCSPLA